MPIPIILGVIAGIAGVAGVGSGINGAVKMKDANDTMKIAQLKQEENQKKLKTSEEYTQDKVDKLITFELEICNKDFKEFSDVFEKIKNRPSFNELDEKINIPKFNLNTLKEVSVGAGILLGGLSGAAAGTASGLAAAGVTTAAVMAVGSASTGTAIASLSGAAATNATLAALGGGALAAGGGGIALGTTVLGAATLGVGLLVGGVIFNITGSNLSDKADEAWEQAKKAEETVGKICNYLQELYVVSDTYEKTLHAVWKKYKEVFGPIEYNVNCLGKVDYNDFSRSERKELENLILLVKCLYNMCKVKLVLKDDNDKEVMNKINYKEVEDAVNKSLAGLREVA